MAPLIDSSHGSVVVAASASLLMSVACLLLCVLCFRRKKRYDISSMDNTSVKVPVSSDSSLKSADDVVVQINEKRGAAGLGPGRGAGGITKQKELEGYVNEIFTVEHAASSTPDIVSSALPSTSARHTARADDNTHRTRQSEQEIITQPAVEKYQLDQNITPERGSAAASRNGNDSTTSNTVVVDKSRKKRPAPSPPGNNKITHEGQLSIGSDDYTTNGDNQKDDLEIVVDRGYSSLRERHITDSAAGIAIDKERTNQQQEKKYVDDRSHSLRSVDSSRFILDSRVSVREIGNGADVTPSQLHLQETNRDKNTSEPELHSGQILEVIAAGVWSSKKKNPNETRNTGDLNVGRYTAHCSFRGQHPEQLSVARGTRLYSDGMKRNGWTWCSTDNPKVSGWYPHAYLQPLLRPDSDTGSKYGGADEESRAELTATVYSAIYQYDASHPEDLTLLPGDEVLVTDTLDHVWWRGVREDGTEGWFPQTFVQAVPKTPEVEDEKNGVPAIDRFVIPKTATIVTPTTPYSTLPSRPAPPTPGPIAAPRTSSARKKQGSKKRSAPLPPLICPNILPPTKPPTHEIAPQAGNVESDLTFRFEPHMDILPVALEDKTVHSMPSPPPEFKTSDSDNAPRKLLDEQHNTVIVMPDLPNRANEAVPSEGSRQKIGLKSDIFHDNSPTFLISEQSCVVSSTISRNGDRSTKGFSVSSTENAQEASERSSRSPVNAVISTNETVVEMAPVRNEASLVRLVNSSTEVILPVTKNFSTDESCMEVSRTSHKRKFIADPQKPLGQEKRDHKTNVGSIAAQPSLLHVDSFARAIADEILSNLELLSTTTELPRKRSLVFPNNQDIYNEIDKAEVIQRNSEVIVSYPDELDLNAALGNSTSIQRLPVHRPDIPSPSFLNTSHDHNAQTVDRPTTENNSSPSLFTLVSKLTSHSVQQPTYTTSEEAHHYHQSTEADIKTMHPSRISENKGTEVKGRNTIVHPDQEPFTHEHPINTDTIATSAYLTPGNHRNITSRSNQPHSYINIAYIKQWGMPSEENSQNELLDLEDGAIGTYVDPFDRQLDRPPPLPSLPPPSHLPQIVDLDHSPLHSAPPSADVPARMSDQDDAGALNPVYSPDENAIQAAPHLYTIDIESEKPSYSQCVEASDETRIMNEDASFYLASQTCPRDKNETRHNSSETATMLIGTGDRDENMTHGDIGPHCIDNRAEQFKLSPKSWSLGNPRPFKRASSEDYKRVYFNYP